jgi:5'-3' exonuclease
MNTSDEYKDISIPDFENAIIENVISGIEKYIALVQPSDSVYIAFDGVAPFAKMQQQKTRRYKTQYMADLKLQKQSKWNTSAITPGTPFMELLSKRIAIHFKYNERKYNLKRIMCSGSNEVGEGEHKLTEYIRDSQIHNDNIALYGLDADLIMLSIFHLKYCKNIWVFREAPEFIKSSIPVEVKGGIMDLYFLDIDLLANSIVTEMNCSFPDKHRVYDYVFLCFLLGNDFLPHFPAMNIRTHGIDVLMNIYRIHIGKHPDYYFISKETYSINWKHVGTFITEIAKLEKDLLINEYSVRDKFDKRSMPASTDEEKLEVTLNLPILFRAEEKYICPTEKGWEKRYYKTLFHEEFSISFLKNLCINYLEGLEWVFKYYSRGCPDWKWKYNYHYPPLFNDLRKYIPHFETDFIHSTNSFAFSPQTQLSFVMPQSQLELLPPPICKFLKTNYAELYPTNYKFQWSFCRYFWESHPILPDIPIQLLEQWDIQFKMNETV